MIQASVVISIVAVLVSLYSLVNMYRVHAIRRDVLTELPTFRWVVRDMWSRRHR